MKIFRNEYATLKCEELAGKIKGIWKQLEKVPDTKMPITKFVQTTMHSYKLCRRFHVAQAKRRRQKKNTLRAQFYVIQASADDA